MTGSTSRRYPPVLRERAVRVVAGTSGDHDSQRAAMSEAARLLDIGTSETVRKWSSRTRSTPANDQAPRRISRPS